MKAATCWRSRRAPPARRPASSGLTWIEEWQAILVRPNSGIAEPKDLKGMRLGLPAYIDNPIADHVRPTSIARSMSLHGYKGALAFAGLTFDDVDFVEVGKGRSRSAGRDAPRTRDSVEGLWDVQALPDGKVDAAVCERRLRGGCRTARRRGGRHRPRSGFPT